MLCLQHSRFCQSNIFNIRFSLFECTYLNGSEGVRVRIQVVWQSRRMVIDQDVIICDARRTTHVATTLVVSLTRQEILHLPLVPIKEKGGNENLTAQSACTVGGSLCFQEVCYDSDLQQRVGRGIGKMINEIE